MRKKKQEQGGGDEGKKVSEKKMRSTGWWGRGVVGAERSSGPVHECAKRDEEDGGIEGGGWERTGSGGNNGDVDE